MLQTSVVEIIDMNSIRDQVFRDLHISACNHSPVLVFLIYLRSESACLLKSLSLLLVVPLLSLLYFLELLLVEHFISRGCRAITPISQHL